MKKEIELNLSSVELAKVIRIVRDKINSVNRFKYPEYYSDMKVIESKMVRSLKDHLNSLVEELKEKEI